jgi:glutathione synthase/RimK-type ligase-like ATP-grasp enzyme
VLRSTWDYHRMPTMFLAWLDSLAESSRVTMNPPQVARGNVDKIYLQTLLAAGIAIPKTRWLGLIDNETIGHAMNEERWDRVVLKPRIAATAYGTFLISKGSTLSDEELAPAKASGALLQEVVPEIVEHGETSMVFAAGAFSHAVVKRAKDGEFRVQQDFGGRVDAVSPSASLVSFAASVMAHVADSCLYARVDVVESRSGPVLMELELIEPELYFLHVPDAANRMAQLIADRLS